ncbi:hypothetical protein ACIA2T_23840 [Amycolatopsis japonica]|uniref:hypothetical protein n=1 Tax=Amycolatopsis japonica TaxID=208439 RepID=UPI00379D7318
MLSWLLDSALRRQVEHGRSAHVCSPVWFTGNRSRVCSPSTSRPEAVDRFFALFRWFYDVLNVVDVAAGEPSK